MTSIRSQRFANCHVPTIGFTLPTLVLAALLHLKMLETTSDRVIDVLRKNPDQALIEMAATLLLGLACLFVLFVQARQPRINRTPLAPGLVLGYAAWIGAPIPDAAGLPIALWGYTPLAMRVYGTAFLYVLPGIAMLTAGTALLMLVLRRPVTLQAFGYSQFYRADPELIEQCKPAKVAAKAKPTPAPAPPTPKPQETPQAPAQPQYRYPAVRPRIRFDDLYGNGELKNRLCEAGQAWKTDGKNGILLFGPPGTGKTVFAEALAGELGLGFMKITFGDLASKWINQSTEQPRLEVDQPKYRTTGAGV